MKIVGNFNKFSDEKEDIEKSSPSKCQPNEANSPSKTSKKRWRRSMNRIMQMKKVITKMNGNFLFFLLSFEEKFCFCSFS